MKKNRYIIIGGGAQVLTGHHHRCPTLTEAVLRRATVVNGDFRQPW